MSLEATEVAADGDVDEEVGETSLGEDVDEADTAKVVAVDVVAAAIVVAVDPVGFGDDFIQFGNIVPSSLTTRICRIKEGTEVCLGNN